MKFVEIFRLRYNFFMTRRLRAFRRRTLSRKRIEASNSHSSAALRLFHNQPKYMSRGCCQAAPGRSVPTPKYIK